MNVGIVGLGLIGGSFAKALTKSNHTVIGYDINQSITDYAKMLGVVKLELDKSTLTQCNVVFLCITPDAAIEYLQSNAENISKDTIICDCCGTKRKICKVGFELAEKHGFTFIGGHPMAGIQFSGFKHSSAELFKDTSMILVPKQNEDIAVLDKLHKLLTEVGFSSFSLTNAQNHDKIIAYTSQLAHVVSNAYVKSPTAQNHHNYSAGSYKDLTRVAKLNEDMWTELFNENSDHLATEIDILINELSKYRDALVEKDNEKLHKLLRDGRIRKEEIDTEWKELK